MTTDQSSSSGFLPIGTFSTRWSDITLIQRRSHAVIYSAVRYQRRFLLKALPPDSADLSNYRLQQENEFRLGISLSHPNIAATYAMEDVEGCGRCIVQEYIDGSTLSEWLATKPSVKSRERVLDQLFLVLDYIHSRQLVHHDLKSGNLMVTRNGANLKLIDFGLSSTDDSLFREHNDRQTDIAAVRQIIRLLFPYRYWFLFGDPERAVRRRRLLRKLIPVMLLIFGLLSLSWILFSRLQTVRHQMTELTIHYDTIIDAAQRRDSAISSIVWQRDSMITAMSSEMQQIRDADRQKVTVLSSELQQYRDAEQQKREMNRHIDAHLKSIEQRIRAFHPDPEMDKTQIRKAFSSLSDQFFAERDSIAAALYPDDNSLRMEFLLNWSNRYSEEIFKPIYLPLISSHLK